MSWKSCAAGCTTALVLTWQSFACLLTALGSLCWCCMSCPACVASHVFSVWYSSSLQSGKREFSIPWQEIRPCSSLSQQSEFMGCSWKSLKTIYTELYVNCMLSSPVWETRRDVWLENALQIFGNLINNKTQLLNPPLSTICSDIGFLKTGWNPCS